MKNTFYSNRETIALYQKENDRLKKAAVRASNEIQRLKSLLSETETFRLQLQEEIKHTRAVKCEYEAAKAELDALIREYRHTIAQALTKAG